MHLLASHLQGSPHLQDLMRLGAVFAVCSPAWLPITTMFFKFSSWQPGTMDQSICIQYIFHNHQSWGAHVMDVGCTFRHMFMQLAGAPRCEWQCQYPHPASDLVGRGASELPSTGRLPDHLLLGYSGRVEACLLLLVMMTPFTLQCQQCQQRYNRLQVVLLAHGRTQM